MNRAFGPSQLVRTSSCDSVETLVSVPCPGSLVFGLWSLVLGLWSLVHGLWSLVSFARAPARAGESNGPGSAAVLGRINPTTDCTTRFDHSNPTTEHKPAGCGQECPRSRNASGNPNGFRSAAVPGRIDPTADHTPASITQTRPRHVHRPAPKLRVCPHIAFPTQTQKTDTHSYTRWDQYNIRPWIPVASVVNRLDLVLLQLLDRGWHG